jgi:toxin ParE1/3/4
MAQITVRPLAEADIDEIWSFIAGRNESGADRWVDELDQKMRLWATQPLMGHERPELVDGLRSMPFGDYMVFYMALPDGIDVVRVLHGRRKYEAEFGLR